MSADMTTDLVKRLEAGETMDKKKIHRDALKEIMRRLTSGVWTLETSVGGFDNSAYNMVSGPISIACRHYYSALFFSYRIEDVRIDNRSIDPNGRVLKRAKHVFREVLKEMRQEEEVRHWQDIRAALLKAEG